MRIFCLGISLAVLFFVIGLVPGRSALAVQQTCKIEKASKKYDIVVKIDSCDTDNLPRICSGSGHISILKKGEDRPFQVIKQDSLWLDNAQTAYNPQLDTNRRMLYDHEYSLIVGDFNFDGEEDLAICNGTNGGYGARSYTVYLFGKRSKKFVGNENFSRLADGVYLGMFFPDPKKKLLRAYWKSGAGYQVEETYKVVNNRPVLFEKIEQEATETGHLIVTTRKRINGRWAENSSKAENQLANEGASALKYEMIDMLKSFKRRPHEYTEQTLHGV